MRNETIDAIISGLKGEFIHSDPFSILKNLTPDIARKKAPGFNHSIWDLLYHTVIWNDIFLTNIKGDEANWNPSNNWPSDEEKEQDQNFTELLQRFTNNVQEVKDLLASQHLDFTAKHRISPDNAFELTTIKLFMTILQHISYHMGQIATVRKMVDKWPPT